MLDRVVREIQARSASSSGAPYLESWLEGAAPPAEPFSSRPVVEGWIT